MISSIGNTLDTQAPQSQAANAACPQNILGAIKAAANRTGVDFAYLVKKAAQESSFNTNAKANGSSATGLYQFTGQTWLGMVKKYGAQYGLKNCADAITCDASGSYHVTDSTAKKSILALRKDPQISAEMAGELDKENNASLLQKIGGKIGATELYLAHFLGASGASHFLKTMRTSPQTEAASVLPDAAAANSSVFYNADGQPKTLAQIYQHFAQKFSGTTATPTLTASTTPALQAQTQPIASASLASLNSPITIKMAATSPFSVTAQASNSSSLFTTMLLAQGNISDFSLTHLFSQPNAHKTGKNGTGSILATSA